MTVLAFMVPSRVSSRPKAQSRKGRGRRNRGRPERRRNPYPRKPNVYTVKTWRPPVPEPLPPAPLLGLRDLGLIGLAGLLSQLWPRLNGPARSRMEGKTDYPGNTAEVSVFGKYSLTGATRITYPENSVQDLGVMREGNNSSKGCIARNGGGWPAFTSNAFTGFKGLWFEPGGGAGSCYPTRTIEWGVVDGAGTRIRIGTASPDNSTESKTAIVGRIGVTTTAPDAVTIKDVPTIYPWRSPEPAELAPLKVKPLLLPVSAPATNPRRLPLVATPSEETAPRPRYAPTLPMLPVSTLARPALKPLAPAQAINPDGSLAPAPVPDPVVTPPESIIPWPGAPPIGSPGQAPRPDLQSIAQEVGKIERKLEIMNGAGRPPVGSSGNPLDLLGLLGDIWIAMQGLNPPTYKLDSPCEVDEDGNKLPPVEVPVSGAVTAFGSMAARMDALAELLQVHKNLKQPICPPQRFVRTGEPVTVTFRSEELSPNSDQRLVKKLNYLDQTSAPLENHVTHWKDFEWLAGPVCVIHKGGLWGVPQVWAATAEEGKRVIRHAAAIAGVDTEAAGTSWIITGTPDQRYGQRGTMRVSRKGGVIWVTKRPGSSGPPLVAVA